MAPPEIRSMRPSKPLLAALLVLVVALPVCAKKEKKQDQMASTGAVTTSAGSGSDVMATVGDRKITLAEVDKKAASNLAKIRQQEYDIRRNALEQILQEDLYQKEAQARGVTIEELARVEIDSKVPAPTAEEISKFYNENKERMGGRTLEQVNDDISKFLLSQKTQARRKDFFNEVMTKNNVAILLDSPRVSVAVREEDRTKGPKDAPVTIVEFSDFQCPFCKRAQAVVDDILRQYPDKVRLVYRDYPLPFHPQAGPAAEAAHCAGDQGKYWEYNHHLMSVEGSLQPDDLKKRATELGLDMASFQQCVDGTKWDATIKQTTDEAAALGVTGTPTFFINGRMIVGAQPDQFKAIIEEEIQRAARNKGGSQVGG
jgi:protein-disulfide isomerase